MAIFAIAAFSQRAEAASNTSLTINITVTISSNIDIVWNNGLVTTDRSWGLGTGTQTVNLGTAYASNAGADRIPVGDSVILNRTTNVPIQLNLGVNVAGTNWIYAADQNAPALNKFLLGFDLDNSGTFTALGGATSANAILGTPLQENDTVDVAIQFTTPQQVSTGNSGDLSVTFFAAVL